MPSKSSAIQLSVKAKEKRGEREMNLDSEIDRLDEELKLLKMLSRIADAVIIMLTLTGACILRYSSMRL